MIKILKEPLLHFLILGSLLFLGYEFIGDGPANNTLLVSSQKIVQLETLFEKTWQRPPTEKELKALIDNFILEEIYYREALALGLDEDDRIIKRRLKQKMEFISSDLTKLISPTDEELTEYLQQNTEKFTRDASYDFKQIYINPDKHDSPEVFVLTLLNTAKETLQDDTSLKGDNTLLPGEIKAASSRLIDRTFGKGFADDLEKQPLQQWTGPIHSSFGLHLVFIAQKQPATVPALNEIRAVVLQEWTYEKQTVLKEAMDQRLRENYQVVIDWPSLEVDTVTETPQS